MTEVSPPERSHTLILQRIALTALLMLPLLIAGCGHETRQPLTPTLINPAHVQLIAYVDGESPCQLSTIQILRDLEHDNPAQLSVTIVDVANPAGHERWLESGLDSVAIEIDGYSSVTWGEGDDRRTVCFMHPPGFSWTHDDLKEAIEAALAGALRSADPAEAEGVRLMAVSMRGQSVQVDDDDGETGQLIIQDQIVLEITQPHHDLTPGYRVSKAAEILGEVLHKPLTPNQLHLSDANGRDGTALLAGDVEILVATEADVAGSGLSTEMLAEQWRLALRKALIEVALQRPATPEPLPPPIMAAESVEDELPGTAADALPTSSQPAL